jgi:hypothetical protein
MFHGEHSYTGFVDDVAKHCNYCLEVPLQNNQEEAYIEDVTRAPALPAALQGISKYLFVEAIDGNIIEVAPRLGMQGARQKYIDEYKLIDPTWVEPNDLGFGLVDQRLRPDIAGGHRWEAQESTRRPFVQDL